MFSLVSCGNAFFGQNFGLNSVSVVGTEAVVRGSFLLNDFRANDGRFAPNGNPTVSEAASAAYMFSSLANSFMIPVFDPWLFLFSYPESSVFHREHNHRKLT